MIANRAYWIAANVGSKNLPPYVIPPIPFLLSLLTLAQFGVRLEVLHISLM